jgi:nucleotide-binding universal stress UspA family protein
LICVNGLLRASARLPQSRGGDDGIHGTLREHARVSHQGENMFKKILLPTDGSDLSRKAVKKGIEFAKSQNAAVVGFFSPEDYRALMYSEYIPPSLLSQKEFEANARKAAERHLAYVEKQAKAAGVAYEGYFRSSIAPWEAIVDAAKKKRCDLIFMASHGRTGLAGLVLGSQTSKVLSHSKVPVMVYR